MKCLIRRLSKICAAGALSLAAATAPVFSYADEEPAPAASTAASYKQFCYNLKPSTTSAQIVVPAVTKPIHMMVSQAEDGVQGVGEVVLLRVSPPDELTWVGWDFASTTREAGTSGVPGTHIMYADTSGDVDVQVASATAVKVANNNNTFIQHGCLTFIW
jgi:hypothetical protein